jgi:RND family efflux transporter MFP subunit
MRKAACLLLLALAACSRGGAKAVAAAPPISSPVARGVVESQNGVVRVAAPRDGVVLAVAVEEGDRVAAGQPLARLDARQAAMELEAARSEADERRADSDGAGLKAKAAERESRRLTALAQADAAPRQQADEAADAALAARTDARRALAGWRSADAHARLDAYEVEVRTIRAPVGGSVIRREAIAGASVAAGAPLFTLESNGPRIVRAELDETFAATLSPGVQAQLTPEFAQGAPCTAHVSRVSRALAAPTLGDEGQVHPDQRVLVAILPLPQACRFPLGQRILVRFGR